MGLSAYLEVTETKVRLAHRRWQDFVLPPTPSSTTQQSFPPSSASSLPGIDSRSPAALALATSLSNLQLSGDDAATIQRKVTEAVLGTKSTLRQIVDAIPQSSGSESGNAGGVKRPYADERESSASTTAVGSQAPTESDATPGANGDLSALGSPLGVSNHIEAS